MAGFRRKNNITVRIIALAMIFVFCFQQGAFAARSSAGGGKISKFNAGSWALGTAVGMGSMAIGGAIASGINNIGSVGGFGAGFGNSLGSLSSLSTWATNFNTGVALGQVSRAVGTMGQYYDWGKSTVAINAIVGGMAAGGINPGSFGASSTLGGIGMGAVQGLIEAPILYSLADSKGNVEPWGYAVAGLAGGLGTSFVSGGLKGGGGFNIDSGFSNMSKSFAPQLVSSALNMGSSYIVQSASPEDRYLISQALSGAKFMVTQSLFPTQKNGYSRLKVNNNIVSPVYSPEVRDYGTNIYRNPTSIANPNFNLDTGR